jgi:hypothetical protein
MKNKDLKKLALMGFTGAIMCTAQPVESNETLPIDTNEATSNMMAHACGSGGGCAGSPTAPKGGSGGRSGCSGRTGCNGRTSCNGRGGCGGQGSSSQQGGHGCGGRSATRGMNQDGEVAEADTNEAVSNPGRLSEQDLQNKLDAQGKANYQNLSPAGKAAALKMANQACKGQNECKGQNSCKSDTNSCAGQGGCKGTSNCSFKDKNAAVKNAAKMDQKRANSGN